MKINWGPLFEEGPTTEEMRQGSRDAFRDGEITLAEHIEFMNAIEPDDEDDDDNDLPGTGLFSGFSLGFVGA